MGSRQRESVFKGRVKRLLREQEDMGQVADSAVQCVVAAVEALVHDLGRKLQAQHQQQDEDNEGSGHAVITPVELKRVVLADPTLAFLHGVVEGIDERDAKYHKRAPRKRKAAAGALSAKPAAKKRLKVAERTPTPAPRASAAPAAELAIEEDDDYDESDSE